MLVHSDSCTTSVISTCRVQLSSFTDRAVRLRRSLAIEKKYVFVIKEMDILSKALVKFHGTLDFSELSSIQGEMVFQDYCSGCWE